MHEDAAAAAAPNADMRVVVQVAAASHPDLHDALLTVPVRRRAERMRMLAVIGLTVLAGQQHGPAVAMASPPAAPAEPAPNHALDERRQRLLGRLRT
jgi:hypothetical protein